MASGGILEELNDITEVQGNRGFHVEDAMQVVGHELQGYHGYLRMVVVDGVPLATHRFSQGGKKPTTTYISSFYPFWIIFFG